MDYFKGLFDYVSNPYFGKTINLRGRFNKHHLQKQKSNEMIVMLALTVLGEEDIPALEKDRCEHTVDSWGCTMERLLINAAKRSGIQLYDGTAEVGEEVKQAQMTHDMQPFTCYFPYRIMCNKTFALQIATLVLES